MKDTVRWKQEAEGLQDHMVRMKLTKQAPATLQPVVREEGNDAGILFRLVEKGATKLGLSQIFWGDKLPRRL